MRIAVDVMGGDFAPEELIKGTLAAAEKHPDWQFILVGSESVLSGLALPENARCEYSATVMAMDESVENLRKKRDSSIWVATALVKKNEADAILSAGSTGAQMAAALLQLGRVPGVSRPAICLTLPGLKGTGLLLDVGANADVTPDLLLQFAKMGSVYAEKILHKENPKVALLSNGSEECKGNELTVAAHELLAGSELNFIGNMEGRDILLGGYDVMVCDGFTGNVALKMAEGVGMMVLSVLKESMAGLAAEGQQALMAGLQAIKKKLDYSEYGGAPLLGVNGVSIVCHGSSHAAAVERGIEEAAECVKMNFVSAMAASMRAE